MRIPLRCAGITHSWDTQRWANRQPDDAALAKTSKAAPRTAVFTHHDPALLVAPMRGEKVQPIERSRRTRARQGGVCARWR
jgi:hypothetical protein